MLKPDFTTSPGQTQSNSVRYLRFLKEIRCFQRIQLFRIIQLSPFHRLDTTEIGRSVQ